MSAPHLPLLSYSIITSYRSPHHLPLYHRIDHLFMPAPLFFYYIIASYCKPFHHTVQKHLVYTMERAVAAGDQAAKSEKIVLIIDYEGFTLSGGPPLKTSQETLSILQNHYPERLQCAYLIRLIKTLIIIHSFFISVTFFSILFFL